MRDCTNNKVRLWNDKYYLGAEKEYFMLIKRANSSRGHSNSKCVQAEELCFKLYEKIKIYEKRTRKSTLIVWDLIIPLSVIKIIIKNN